MGYRYNYLLITLLSLALSIAAPIEHEAPVFSIAHDHDIPQDGTPPPEQLSYLHEHDVNTRADFYCLPTPGPTDCTFVLQVLPVGTAGIEMMLFDNKCNKIASQQSPFNMPLIYGKFSLPGNRAIFFDQGSPTETPTIRWVNRLEKGQRTMSAYSWYNRCWNAGQMLETEPGFRLACFINLKCT